MKILWCAKIDFIFASMKLKVLIIALACSSWGYAQGVKGYITDAKGDTLPFVSVFMPGTGKGVSANAKGYYELALDSGQWDVVYQYVGYNNVRKTFTITDEWKQHNVVMQSNATTLNTIEVRPGEEDPAIAIMRQAIARSKYHRLLVDEYRCKVYTRGSGKITEAPAFIRKLLERDDIYINQTFTTESISELHFRQPDSMAEKVIAMRTVATETPSPNSYINASFYHPKVAGAVSPLAPNAFYYYRFGYRGSFSENGRTVYKISVTPKTRGMDTYSGTIYISEGDYAIHSIDLTTFITGFKVNIKQLHQSVQEEVWMPVNHRIDFSGKIMGVAGEYTYVANVDDYMLTINPSVRTIDVKIEEDDAEEYANERPELDAAVVVNSKKELKRELKRIEKEQYKKRNEAEVVTHRYKIIDSNATKWSEEDWLTSRPIPLSSDEQRGYDMGDSIAEEKGTNKDTINFSKRFEWSDLFLGSRYNLSKYSVLRWHSPVPLMGYNTVEGFFLQGKMSYSTWVKKRYKLESYTTVRHGFSEHTTYAKGGLSMKRRRKENTYGLRISGGHFVEQFDENQPVSDVVNTLHTLLLGQNFQKLYARTYVGMEYYSDWNRKLELSLTADANNRVLLNNTSDSRWLFASRDLLPNQPVDNLHNHRAYRAGMSLTYRPNLTYRSYNGYKTPNLNDQVAEYNLRLRSGVYETGSGFAHLQLSYAKAVSFGVSGTLDWNLVGGTFFNTDPMFQDVQHFLANQTAFAPINTRKQFRIMPYYTYFTQDHYAQAMTHYEFRKLLVTQFFYPRILGVKEQVFVNGIVDAAGNHYLETGYSLMNIFRAFRVDVGVSLLPETGRVGLMIGLGGLIQFE